MSEDLHAGVPLTDISVAYQDVARSFIADHVFPRVSIGGRPGYYDGSYPAPPARRPRLERIPMHDVDLSIGHHPLDQELIREHVLALQVGGELAPVEVEEWSIADDYGEVRSGYTLTDGRHRFVAHLIAGSAEIPARVKPW